MPGAVERSSPPLLILFGSETGNAQVCWLEQYERALAQDVAERISREAKRRNFSPLVVAMNAFEVQDLPLQRAALFVCSTTGQGEVPGNMKTFWAFLLRKSLPTASLSRTQHAVFGLGDSGYQHFNTVAKKLDRRLAALGSQPMLARGLGDDQHFAGYDAALDPWLRALWPALSQAWPLECHDLLPGSEQTLPECKYEVSYIAAPAPAEHMDPHQEELNAGYAFLQVDSAAAGVLPAPSAQQAEPHSAGYGPGRPFMAQMLTNERITSPSHTQDTRHIALDISGSGMAYEPGDLLSIMPRQSRAAVDRFITRAGLDSHAWVSMGPARGADPHCFTQQARVGALVAGALDVDGASPRRFFFEALSHFATAPHELNRLQHFASVDGRDDLAQYNQKEGRTVLEVLEDFPSAQVPLPWLLQIVPRLKPRQFSIASSLRAHPGEAHITAAMVDYRTPHRRRKQGVCTTWLSQLCGVTADAPPCADALPERRRAQPPAQAPAASMAAQESEPQEQAAPHGSLQHPGPSLASDASAELLHASAEPQQAPGQVQLAVGAPRAQTRGTDRVPMWLERGVLHMPVDTSIPLVLIGPGTGIAPFRSFLEERALLRASGRRETAPCYLYFGCRGQQRDFYYRQQWEEYVHSGVLAADGGLVTAFSQDGPSKMHVTHRIRQNGQQLYQLLMQGAQIYISGSAKRMPQDVISAFEQILAKHGGMSSIEAGDFMKRLQAIRRCVVEAWS